MTLPQPTDPEGNEAMTSLSLSSCKFSAGLEGLSSQGGYEFSFPLKFIQTKLTQVTFKHKSFGVVFF